ncbi:MAG: hypothetical protein IPG90_07190 [Bacteroidetes bacterium]|nr:hypothetical protein [Bacteroidota bacterium]
MKSSIPIQVKTATRSGKRKKNGVAIIVDQELSYFDDFVRIYTDNMKTLNAARMYFFSAPFYAQLKKLVKEKGFLILAIKDNVVLGSSVFLGEGNIGHYFLSSAIDEGKKLAVSNLMLHAGILEGRKRGMKIYAPWWWNNTGRV